MVFSNTSDTFYNETEHEVEKLMPIASSLFLLPSDRYKLLCKSTVFVELENIRPGGTNGLHRYIVGIQICPLFACLDFVMSFQGPQNLSLGEKDSAVTLRLKFSTTIREIIDMDPVLKS